ncbi:MAG TPA: hypothetical protein VGX23_14275 [Actinocrinis sp.]|nr:hypothetical protein [Actinocrinis sp.]
MSSKSRTNGRPALPVSSLPALHLDLPAESKSAWLVCPDCRHWVEATRGLVQTHKPDGIRCDGSAQVLDVDLTPAQHATRRAAAREFQRAGIGPRRGPVAVLPEGPRPAARHATVRSAQQRTEAEPRTAMAEALAEAWLKFSRVPVAPPVHRIAAQRALPVG